MTKMLTVSLWVISGSGLISSAPISLQTFRTPSLLLFLSQLDPPDIGRKTGEVPALPPISLTEDRFITRRSRGPFLSSVTDLVAVSAVSAVPRYRLATTSPSLYAS